MPPMGLISAGKPTLGLSTSQWNSGLTWGAIILRQVATETFMCIWLTGCLEQVGALRTFRRHLHFQGQGDSPSFLEPMEEAVQTCKPTPFWVLPSNIRHQRWFGHNKRDLYLDVLQRQIFRIWTSLTAKLRIGSSYKCEQLSYSSYDRVHIQISMITRSKSGKASAR